MLRSVLNEVGVPSAAESTSAPAVVSKRAVRAKSEKKPRKKSGYNIFVSVKMQDEQIKLLNHKEKMGAIGKLWKELDEAGKAKYNTQAQEEQSAPEPAPAV